MKSKLFLGLSLLTAVCSINASFKYDVARKGFTLNGELLHANCYSSLPKQELQKMKTEALNRFFAASKASKVSYKQISDALLAPARQIRYLLQFPVVRSVENALPIVPAAAIVSSPWVDTKRFLELKGRFPRVWDHSPIVNQVVTPVASTVTSVTPINSLKMNSMVPVAGLLTGTALVGSVVLAGKYLQKPEVELTYAQKAQQMMQNGYNAVKANAVKGYELAKANPKTTGGIAAAVLAAGYLVYNSDLFGKSQAVVETPAQKPVVKSAKQRLNAF